MDLAPCPKCAAEQQRVVSPRDNAWFVRCSKCGKQGETAKTRLEAVESWNLEHKRHTRNP